MVAGSSKSKTRVEFILEKTKPRLGSRGLHYFKCSDDILREISLFNRYLSKMKFLVEYLCNFSRTHIISFMFLLLFRFICLLSVSVKLSEKVLFFAWSIYSGFG